MDAGTEIVLTLDPVPGGCAVASDIPISLSRIFFERGSQARPTKSIGTTAFVDCVSQVIPEDLVRLPHIKPLRLEGNAWSVTAEPAVASPADVAFRRAIPRFLAMSKLVSMCRQRVHPDVAVYRQDSPHQDTYFGRLQAKSELVDWLVQEQSRLQNQLASGEFSKRDICRFYTRFCRELTLRSKALRPKRARSLEYRPKLIMVGQKMVEIYDEERAVLTEIFNRFETSQDEAAHLDSLERLRDLSESKSGWEEVLTLVLRALDLLIRHKAGFSRTTGLRLRIRNCMYNLLI
jgi:hypothetical protein